MGKDVILSKEDFKQAMNEAYQLGERNESKILVERTNKILGKIKVNERNG